jgi:uncharacterized protein YkwD
MVLRYATVVFAAAVLATAVALSVSALEPGTARAATNVRTCGGGTISLKYKEERTLILHNRERRGRGLRTLCVHPKLTRAARAHSEDMIRNDYLGHNSTGSRLRRYGYNWRIFAENIGGGTGEYARPRNIFNRWMNSSAHRANILDGRFREIGIGTATGNYKGRPRYTMYTVDFGTRY